MKPVLAASLCFSAYAIALGAAVPAARAQDCPPVTIRVDNDIQGSGYSEDRAQNWESRSTDACHVSYRYLSRTVGDGSRRGRAIWQPSINRTGWYRVIASWRASENRTSDADYVVYGDDGATAPHSIDQRGDGCQMRDLGLVFCRPGGMCRLVLDGNDGQSASADITTFTLVRCGEAPPPPDAGSTPDAGRGPCTGISAHMSFELCGMEGGGCQGVFTQGEGCEAFCAAAGMECVARYGGNPGCVKEMLNPIPCGAQNQHRSDWCECAVPGVPDAGESPDVEWLPETGVAIDAMVPPPSDSGEPLDLGVASDVPSPFGDSGLIGPDVSPNTDAGVGGTGGALDAGALALPEAESSCGCSAAGPSRGSSPWGGAAIVSLALAIFLRRRATNAARRSPLRHELVANLRAGGAGARRNQG